MRAQLKNVPVTQSNAKGAMGFHLLHTIPAVKSKSPQKIFEACATAKATCLTSHCSRSPSLALSCLRVYAPHAVCNTVLVAYAVGTVIAH
jgi:hypothetical protein